MSPQKEKNKSALPSNIENEGEFLKPLPIEGYFDPQRTWYAGLNPWQRLNSHYTYSSVRRNVYFKPFRTIHDHLDLALRTTYRHGKETFPEPVDVLFQPFTVNIGLKDFGKYAKGSNKKLHSSISSVVFLTTPQDILEYKSHPSKTCPIRRLSNIRKLVLSKQLLPVLLIHVFRPECKNVEKINHPLIIGGIKEKVHPSYVKLMNSSHHSPLTNAGYVRQDRDGTMFYY